MSVISTGLFLCHRQRRQPTADPTMTAPKRNQRRAGIPIKKIRQLPTAKISPATPPPTGMRCILISGRPASSAMSKLRCERRRKKATVPPSARLAIRNQSSPVESPKRIRRDRGQQNHEHAYDSAEQKTTDGNRAHLALRGNIRSTGFRRLQIVGNRNS